MFFTDNDRVNSSNISKVQYTATVAEPVLNVNSVANRSRYATIEIPNTNPTKYSRVSIQPQRNPIKHYRRQYSTTTSRHPSQLKMLDMPGKSIVRLDECPNCDASNVAFTCVEIEQDDNTEGPCAFVPTRRCVCGFFKADRGGAGGRGVLHSESRMLIYRGSLCFNV